MPSLFASLCFWNMMTMHLMLHHVFRCTMISVAGAMVLHRDIRPDNVGLARGGVVKVRTICFVPVWVRRAFLALATYYVHFLVSCSLTFSPNKSRAMVIALFFSSLV